ncbi:MAG: FAD-linked oxidase C-terminal domain-containing protein [Polyangiaceae bacterium]
MLLSREPLPELSPDQRDKLRLLLDRALGSSKVLLEREACERFGADESEAAPRIPDAVVLAKGAEDILAALQVAREAGVPITPRAGGTGRSGGAVPVAGGIVLAVEGMNQIKEIDRQEGIAVVGPGVVLGELHRAVEAEGWFYPPDPNSWETCALGGNVAENAGGPRAFKYGTTRQYVLGLEAFLIGGQRLSVGRRTVKGVTGYDVTGLLVGSEGTLAVFGDITLRLIPKPPVVMTLMALFAGVRDSVHAVARMTREGLVPRCIELLDRHTLQAMRSAGNAIEEGAGAMLLMDVDGEPAQCEAQAERVAAACEGALSVLVAQDAGQREKLWSARREMSLSVRRMARHKLAEDVVVGRQRVVELLDRVDRISEDNRIRSLTYGHAGDGNLHVNFLWDHDDELPRVDACIEALFRAVVELGGTLSGEHGIGILKAPYLGLEQSAELIALQRDLKRVFDPAGLLNPGKVFPALGHGAC